MQPTSPTKTPPPEQDEGNWKMLFNDSRYATNQYSMAMTGPTEVGRIEFCSHA